MATRTATTTTATTPASNPGRPSGAVTTAKSRSKKAVTGTTGSRRRASGPRFFSWLRFSLVVSTLVASVLGVIAVVVSQSDQANALASQASSLNLLEMQAIGAEAQSDALTSLLDPTGSKGTDGWQAYTTATETMTDLLLTATGSTTNPTDLRDAAQSFAQWQSALFSAHQDALGSGVTSDTLKPVATTYTAMIDELTARVGVQANTNVAISIVAFVVLGLVLIGFVVALVTTARRTHRVINVGLAVALILSLGSAYVMAWYNAQTNAAYSISSATWQLTGVRVDAWNTRSLAATALLDPTTRATSPTATETASQLELHSSGWWYELSTEGEAVVSQVTSINSATPDQARALVLDASTWSAFSDTVGTLTSYTPSTSSVVPAFIQASLIAGLGAGTVIATLAGVHARTKEYA